MPENKVLFVTSEFKITLTCPECSNRKQVDVSKFMALKTEAKLKAKCKCGNKFAVTLERRRSIRKDVYFPGWMKCKGNKYKIRVRELSKHGVQIHLLEKAPIESGQQVNIEFTVDDPLQSIITRQVKVKKLFSSTVIGCEFLEFEHSGNLGKYFLFHF